MKLVFSLNGHDNVGKTTQARRLSNNNPGLVAIVNDLSSYPGFPAFSGRDLFRWWFHDSSPEEFCQALYGCVAAQIESIGSYDSPIVIVDKGVPTIDARVMATLKVRGISPEKAEQMQVSAKERLGIVPNSIDLFLQTNRSPAQQVEIALTRSTDRFGDSEERTYAAYELEQTAILQRMLREGRFVPIKADGSIEEVYPEVVTAISHKMSDAVPKSSARIIGLGGMSESGKSSAGYYLSRRHGIWNLKLRYFVDQIARRYHSGDGESPIQFDDEIVAPLIAEGIVLFLRSHYYKDAISVESLHGDRFTNALRRSLGGRMEVVYIDTPLELRVQRTVQVTGKDVSVVTSEILAKDNHKSGKGTERIKDSADVVIDNSRTVSELHRSLDLIAFQKWRYEGRRFEVDETNIPVEYKAVIRSVLDELSVQFGASLIFLLLGGSCGRGDAHPGWSDIDLIVGLEHYGPKQRSLISEIVSGKQIKVGTTVYSRRELEAGFVDPKTAATFYYLQRGDISPIVYNPELELPLLSREEIARRNYSTLPDKVHTLRRLLYASAEEFDVQTVLRTTAAIMKICLFDLGLDASGYRQSCELFSQRFGVRLFDPSPFLRGSGDREDLRDYAAEILGAIL